MKGQLVKKIFLNGKTKVLTGLHIGGSDIGLAVGGTDNVIIRNPVTNQPYIPGSSLKGKMRSLFEKVNGEFSCHSKEITNGPCQDASSKSGRLFGINATGDESGQSRLIVRDGKLLNPKVLESAKTDMPYSEIKTEIILDRVTSHATPRQIERVPAGAEFELFLVLDVFEGDDEKEYLGYVFEALALVQDDYLGGGGTRGSGEVKFILEGVLYKDKEIYESNTAAKPFSGLDIPAKLK
jgi:CRISPR-associated protein Csm3